MRIGVYGGTFNPPHIGHLILAEEVRERLSLDKVLWVLTPVPPHKPSLGIIDAAFRCRMVQLTIAGNPDFSLSTVEINREPPHYAVDTMKLLKESYPEDTLVYLMGKDSLRDLPSWHHPEEFVKLCDYIAVMERAEVSVSMDDLEKKITGIRERTVLVDTPLIAVSSSMIRERIASGRTVRYLLPERVYKLIRENRFYQKGK